MNDEALYDTIFDDLALHYLIYTIRCNGEEIGKFETKKEAIEFINEMIKENNKQMSDFEIGVTLPEWYRKKGIQED